jgi:hypothetical protein
MVMVVLVVVERVEVASSWGLMHVDVEGGSGVDVGDDDGVSF